MQPVTSSWVAAIGYDDAALEIYVELVENGTYAYWPAPASVWQDLQAADSTGTFVNEVLKRPPYRFRKA